MRIDPSITIAGDWQAECQQLVGGAQVDEARGLRLGLKCRERQVEELKRLQVELRQKQAAASAKAGICKIFSAVIGGLVAAVSAVVTIYCPPAAAGVALGGALISGSIGIGGAQLDSRAVQAKAAEIRAGSGLEQAGQERLELLGALEQLAVADRRAGEAVRNWIDSDSDIRGAVTGAAREGR